MTSLRPRSVEISKAYGAYALGILTLVNLLNYLERNVIFALFDPIKVDLALSDAQLGWVASAYVLVFSIAALPLGVLGDIRSRRMVIAFGVLLWSTFTTLGGLAHSFPLLFFCRAMVGIGGAAAVGACSSLVADYFTGPRRAFAMGLFMAGLSLGGVLGILLGGQLTTHYGWRTTLIALGTPGFLLAIFVARLRQPPRTDAPKDQSMWAALVEVAQASRVVTTIKTLVFVFLGGALISFGANGLIGWAPTFMARELGISIDRVAVLLGKYGLLFGIGGTIFGGVFADWLRRYTATARVLTAGLGLLFGAPLIMWLLTIRDLNLFIRVFCAAFFFLAWYSGPLTAVIFDVVPAKIGTTVVGAYFLFIHLAGDTIAFPIVGMISDRIGLDRAVFVLPMVSMVGGLVVLGGLFTVKRDLVGSRLPEPPVPAPA